MHGEDVRAVLALRLGWRGDHQRQNMWAIQGGAVVSEIAKGRSKDKQGGAKTSFVQRERFHGHLARQSCSKLLMRMKIVGDVLRQTSVAVREWISTHRKTRGVSTSLSGAYLWQDLEGVWGRGGSSVSTEVCEGATDAGDAGGEASVYRANGRQVMEFGG